MSPSLLGDNATPPFPTLPNGAFALIVAKAVSSALHPRIHLRDWLKFPDKLHSGLPRVVKTGPEAPYCRPTASFTGVGLADSIRKWFADELFGRGRALGYGCRLPEAGGRGSGSGDSGVRGPLGRRPLCPVAARGKGAPHRGDPV